MRLIHTGFFSPKALNIISAAIAMQKADNKHHAKTTVRRHISNVTVAQDTSGEIVLECGGSWRGEAFQGYSDADALFKIGCFMKQRVMDYLNKRGWRDYWDRLNVVEIEIPVNDTTLRFSIKDFYYIYDMFMGRKTPPSRYTAAYLNEIRGQARDPLTTEMLNSLKDEIASLQKSCDEQAQALQRESWTKSNEASAAVRNEYEAKIKALKAETARKISEIEASINSTLNLELAQSS